MTAYIHSIVKTVSAKFALTVINTATFRNAILQTKKFPSIDRLVTPTGIPTTFHPTPNSAQHQARPVLSTLAWAEPVEMESKRKTH